MDWDVLVDDEERVSDDPVTIRSVADCQDMTWREKEVSEVPWEVVEYTG